MSGNSRYVPLWWVPLLLALTPVVGLSPAPRDIADFFAPMRAMTASSLAAGVVPWLNLANGCGEAWFANPETAVLYPPAWVHLVAPPAWALALEVALHLAWMSLGAGLLARDLGSGSIGRSVVEMATWSVGPVIVTAGVLNNLETLAWVPWMVLAARVAGNRAVGLVAVATAFAWLGGEPQMWALAVVLTVAAARSRVRTVAGVALGSMVVAVQMVPFAFWVLEGDRGPQAASWALRGAMTPADWSGLLVPGLPVDPDRMVYVESFFFGAPLMICGLLGAWRRKWLLAAVGLLGLLATLPEVGGGGIFLALTGGLVRYPSRFALAGLALLLPMMGSGAEEWIEGRGRLLAAAVATLTLALCIPGTHPLRWWVAGLPAALVLAGATFPAWRGVRRAALITGLAGTVAAALPLIGLEPISSFVQDGTMWPEARGGGRIYAPAPSSDVLQWLATGMEPRRLWPVGYLNLDEGLTVARTDSPVANGRLIHHLEMADRGLENRWWLNVLAAPWLVLREGTGVPDDMESVRVRGGMRLLRNRQTLSVVSLALEQPRPDVDRRTNGRVDEIVLDGNNCRATLNPSEDGYAWISLAPVGGWRWFLDGVRAEIEQGPGIVQYIQVAEGRRQLVGRYRPPGIVPAAVTSVAAAFFVGVLLSLPMIRQRARGEVLS